MQLFHHSDANDDESSLNGGSDTIQRTVQNNVTYQSDVFMPDEYSRKKRFSQPIETTKDYKKKLKTSRLRFNSEKPSQKSKTLNDLKLHRTVSDGGNSVITPQDLHNGDIMEVYRELSGNSKSKKRYCVII